MVFPTKNVVLHGTVTTFGTARMEEEMKKKTCFLLQENFTNFFIELAQQTGKYTNIVK